MRVLLTISAAVLLTTACGQTGLPASPTSSASGLSTTAVRSEATVPFKGRFEGTFTVSGDFPVVSIHLEAAGNATHLGRFTLDFPHRVDLIAAKNIPPSIATLTAANGDTLTTSVDGVATPLETPGAFSIVETHTITGGTGRFAGATGVFVVERLATPPGPNGGTTSGTFDGTLGLGS